MAMTRSMSKDLAREIVEGGKQGDRSMTVVIVSLGADMTLAQGQTGLTALEDLTLALLIATQQESAIRRIEIETNHIPELLFKSQVLGKFEALESMGSNCVSRPQTLNARFTQAGFPAPSSARSRLLRQGAVEQPDSRPSGWPKPPLSAWPRQASLSPSRPLAAQRFLQRPMARRLTLFSAISLRG